MKSKPKKHLNEIYFYYPFNLESFNLLSNTYNFHYNFIYYKVIKFHQHLFIYLKYYICLQFISFKYL